MLCYKDRTFCCSDGCLNKCGRRITPEEQKEALQYSSPIAWALFCDDDGNIYDQYGHLFDE